MGDAIEGAHDRARGDDAAAIALRVDAGRCVRCAACAVLAPALFAVDRRGARARRPPADDAERRQASAAALTCPTGAIALAPAPAVREAARG